MSRDDLSGTRDEGQNKAVLAYLFLAIVMLLWAGNSIVGRAVRADVPPFTLALVRWTGALVLMAPFAIGPIRRDAAVLRRQWRIVVLLGLCGVAAFNGFLYLGLHSTTATNAILIQAAIPPLILIANACLFRERASSLQILGTTLSTVGVIIVICRADLALLLALLLGLRFHHGDLYVFCAVIGWAIYTALLRKRPKIDPLSFVATTFLIAALCMLPLAIGEWWQGQRVVWTVGTAGAFVYVAVLPSLLGYLLYNAAVGAIGAGRAGQTITLMPLFGAFLASGLLGEPLYAYDYVGMVFILAGICLSARHVFAPPPKPDATSRAAGRG